MAQIQEGQPIDTYVSIYVAGIWLSFVAIFVVIASLFYGTSFISQVLPTLTVLFIISCIFIFIFHFKIQKLPYYVDRSSLQDRKFDYIISGHISLNMSSHRNSIPGLSSILYRMDLSNYASKTGAKILYRSALMSTEKSFIEWTERMIPNKSASILVVDSDSLMNEEMQTVRRLQRAGYTNVFVSNL